MKHHVRTLTRVVALIAAIGVAGCGGKQTMASKSAAAFDEAKKKGIPIAAGEHGGHSAEPGTKHAGVATDTGHSTMTMNHSTMTGMDHGAMPGMDHSQMPHADHAKMDGMDHSGMAGMDHSKMDHSNMPGMQHGSSGAGAHEMAGMDHSKMPGMQHGSPGSGGHDRAAMGHAAMPGMDHSKMAGMQHGSSTTAPLVIAPPTTNAAIAQTQPAATLRADDFDAPAPAAIDEAKKTAQPPPEHHHGNGEAL